MNVVGKIDFEIPFDRLDPLNKHAIKQKWEGVVLWSVAVEFSLDQLCENLILISLSAWEFENNTDYPCFKAQLFTKAVKLSL